MRHFIGKPDGLLVNLGGSVLVLLLVVAAPAGAAIKELANDGLIIGGSISCQIGFIEGESGAVKLTADPGDYPYQIKKVRALICPEPSPGFAILRIYEDNTGTVLPGPVLYEEIVQVTGSDVALNEIDLSAHNIVIPSGSVRVEFEWYQSSPPGLAHDTHGTIVYHVNYIYAIPGGWSYSEDWLLTGDWIIRMEIETGAEPPIFVDGFETGTPPGGRTRSRSSRGDLPSI